MSDTGIIILAAGNSSRLGIPKQFLIYNAKTLIVHVADEALIAAPECVVVVTGSHSEKMQRLLIGKKVNIVFNERWQSGMASGIVEGVTAIRNKKNGINNIIISVCDQPFISAEIFEQLINKKENTHSGIIACNYGSITGTPVLFNKKYFTELLHLQGDEGAKKLLKLHQGDVGTISFPSGNIDIDTQQDYKNLISNSEI